MDFRSSVFLGLLVDLGVPWLMTTLPQSLSLSFIFFGDISSLIDGRAYTLEARPQSDTPFCAVDSGQDVVTVFTLPLSSHDALSVSL